MQRHPLTKVAHTPHEPYKNVRRSRNVALSTFCPQSKYFSHLQNKKNVSLFALAADFASRPCRLLCWFDIKSIKEREKKKREMLAILTWNNQIVTMFAVRRKFYLISTKVATALRKRPGRGQICEKDFKQRPSKFSQFPYFRLGATERMRNAWCAAYFWGWLRYAAGANWFVVLNALHISWPSINMRTVYLAD